MKVIYDKESDTLSLILKESLVEESDEAKDGIIFDYDAQGNLVSVEILNASERITQPEALEFQLAH
ncbi:DUF2283 domain-containing protein [Candidatus Acetothermia bacterium]|nr:DUF2283 domain-containing protein [Candidatus Acetothermia bacterium]MBI3643514.1 DUF2283 domain-containing protein [Candidatus Acetothermia bacterium]